MRENVQPFYKAILCQALIYSLMTLPTLWILWVVIPNTFANSLSNTLLNTLSQAWKHHRLLLDAGLFSAIGLSGWLFWRGYQQLPWQKSTLEGTIDAPTAQPQWQQVFFGTLVFSLLLAFVVPFHSQDLYGYLNRGIQQAVYQVNPYTTPVADMPHWQSNPLFTPHWVFNPCPYGFLFAQAMGWLTALFYPNGTLILLAFKLLNVGCHLLITWLVYRMSVSLNHPFPARQAYLYGWNPFILLHGIANGHNDVWMAALMLLACWALFSPKKSWLSLPVLTLSILIKYLSLLLLPFVMVTLWRQQKYVALALGLLLSAGITAFLAWPYLPPGMVWPQHILSAMADNATISQHSLVSSFSRLVFYGAKLFVDPATATLWLETTRMVLKKLFLGMFVLGYGILLLRFTVHTPTGALKPRFYEGTALALMVFLFVASAKFQAWYGVMAYPLALLLPDTHFLKRWMLVISAFLLLAFTPVENIHILNSVVLLLVPTVLAWKRNNITTKSTDA